MAVDNALNNGQPNACSFKFVCAVKPLKDAE
jgi:hypothetical protein